MRTWWKILGALAAVTAVLLGAWVIVGVVSGPDRDATELVRMARRALDEVTVRGVVVTVVRTPQGEREVRAEMHRGEGRFTMRILSGDGEGVEIHRQQGAVWVEGREGQTGRRSELGEPGLRPELLERNWSFTSAGTRRVAGRTTTLVGGTGPGGSITLAIDRETGFPLHISRRDPRGKLVSETTWVEADFSAEPPPVKEPPPQAEGRHRAATTLEEARKTVEFTVYEPAWVPEGWELQGWYLHDGHRAKMVGARLSDGLRPMMIIQRAVSDEAAERPEGADRGAWRERRVRDGAPRRPEQPRRAEGREAAGPREAESGRPTHMRGSGVDASRREIDGTMVLVIGPISREERERVLDEMKAP